MPGFAVLDFETTGLFPNGHDRVIELAVVHVNEHGRIEGQWETLINPGRDLGRQDIHRIRAADVISAPSFADIAPRLLELLAGRVVVAHNASFDIRFLIAELERIDGWVNPGVPTLCTMQLARDILPGAGRALADCCAAFDIELEGAHRAAVDALATAQLLAAYIEATDDAEFWFSYIDAASAYEWPSLSPSRVEWFPRPDFPAEVTANTFLERITVKLPDYSGPAECLDYLALLDRCLLDRYLSVHEAQGLVQLAEDLGLSRTTCADLHAQYFDELTQVAWADGVLTDAEMADLVEVANLLDLPTETIAAALDDPTRRSSSDARNERRVSRPASLQTFLLEPGALIVLTGEMTRPRSEWESDLFARGFQPHGAVTKKVALVAAADPDSLSGKARKARDYGIPIVDELTLGRLIHE